MIAMTKKELASAAGYSYRRLHDIDMALPKDKKLFVRSDTDDKKYDLALFVQRWVEYNRQDSQEESVELDKIKALHEKVKKEKTELEVARMKGEFVDLQEVTRLWTNIASLVQGRFVTLARKLAPALVMIEDPEKIEEIIDRDVRDALTMIAKTPLPGEEAEAGTEEGEEHDAD